MLPHLWVLAWSFLQSFCRGYELSNAIDPTQLMFHSNPAQMGMPPFALKPLKRPTSQVKGVQYAGNVGNPYGSNIIEVSAEAANLYKYVVRFEAPSIGQRWTVAIWNNFAPDGRLGGWRGNACRTFTLERGQFRYIAFDDDSQGGWAAAPGLSVPVDGDGRYTATWGEFNFGSKINFGRSAFVVSTIATEMMGLEVQGMRICDVHSDTCSSVSPRGAAVHNAYTSTTVGNGKGGGTILPGPVRLAVIIGYGGFPLPENRS
ncbi:Allergen [Penicillium subrubescens]|uniref:Allergen n=1 Tax=Penicillium subrubescens TaxID=1316194 RepID=UPI002544ED77|nr:Allergen [Penicillium subrubescens]KAJ5904715.1 Allergen [Penicillium subrubescens]